MGEPDSTEDKPSGSLDDETWAPYVPPEEDPGDLTDAEHHQREPGSPDSYAGG